MAKSNPPAIFQTNGPVGLADSRADVAALDSTGFYKLLGDKSMALSIDGKVAAIPYAVEGYGIIYNASIMKAYFALPGAKASSMDEINNFATLKAVVEDMQAKKDQLGIKGVFASTSFGPGQDWRWQTHLFNIALADEFASATDVLAAKDLKFSGSEEYKQIFDLYTENSTTAKGLLGGKSVDDSMAEFALGQCAMVQNGNWAAGQILGVPGNKVAAEDIRFMPIYAGLDGEEHLGLCVGTENYLCINSHISAEDQANADTFLTWLFSSETGKKIVKEDLGFITPFNSFNENELPSDPLAKDVTRWMNKSGISSIQWLFAGIPSEQWKADFGGELLQYLQGNSDWAKVESVAKDSWAREAKIAGR
jgi:ABC-type sugar transport system, periplasmic component